MKGKGGTFHPGKEPGAGEPPSELQEWAETLQKHKAFASVSLCLVGDVGQKGMDAFCVRCN